MNEDPVVTAAFLVIGDEILSGRTADKNIVVVANRLTEIGIDLREVRVVADDEAAIIDALNALRTRFTYVFTSGGIGPTHDDITVDCIGKALGLEVEHNTQAVALMKQSYEARGLELNDTRLRMARMPKGATLVVTPSSGAPGFQIGNIIAMAGVPSIMEGMLASATHQLRGGLKVSTMSVVLWVAESEIAELFASHQRAYPDVMMGSYPSFVDKRYRTELVLRSRSLELLKEAHGKLVELLKARGLIVPA